MYIIREIKSGTEWWIGADCLETARDFANDLPKDGEYEIRRDDE